MPEDRGPSAQTRLERLIVQMAAAINARALYGERHPRLLQAVETVCSAVAAACEEKGQDAITFLIVGDELVADQRPFRQGGLHQQNFIQACKRRGVERLSLARGLEAAECAQLLSAMAGTGPLASTAHVVLGQLQVTLAASGGGTGPPADPRARIDAAREAFVRFRKDRRAGLGQLEEMVWSMMEALSRSTREALPLAPLKDHDEYTFVHSVNVSLLVLAQGRSFGIQGPMLHALGLAALLHDVGKLTIPLAVLNKPGRLEDEEWKIMMSHAELGAWHLCGLEASAPLSILVAYEHHLRYDGQGGYPALSTPRRPALASQMTALADTYDAVSTMRPYQRAHSRLEALEILRKRAGTFHDPFLVGNFQRLLDAEAPSAPVSGPGTRTPSA